MLNEGHPWVFQQERELVFGASSYFYIEIISWDPRALFSSNLHVRPGSENGIMHERWPSVTRTQSRCYCAWVHPVAILAYLS